MRRFTVYLDKKLAGVEIIKETIEFPDNATEEEIEADCKECLNAMIENDLYTGWYELEKDE